MEKHKVSRKIIIISAKKLPGKIDVSIKSYMRENSYKDMESPLKPGRNLAKLNNEVAVSI